MQRMSQVPHDPLDPWNSLAGISELLCMDEEVLGPDAHCLRAKVAKF